MQKSQALKAAVVAAAMLGGLTTQASAEVQKFNFEVVGTWGFLDNWRLLDVSSGIDEFSEWCGDQIDHGYEGVDIAVAPGPSSGGLEDTVEGLEAGIVVV